MVKVNNQLQVSSVSNPQSSNKDGMRVAFQPDQVPQMIIGVILFTLNIVQIAAIELTTTCIIGYGIWGGTSSFISGLLSILTGKKDTNKCLIISTMVMNIISAAASAPVMSFGVVDASVYFHYDKFYWMNNKEIRIWMGLTIACLAIIEAIISITCSALCCKAYCCCSRVDNVVVLYGYPGNVSDSNESGYQALMLPPQLSEPPPFPQQPNVDHQPPVSQTSHSSQINELETNIPSLYDYVERY